MTRFAALKTKYNNCWYLSRLEARWKVYFDALGIEATYELQGYDLGEAGWYLPDFYLPHVDMWAEVKPVQFSDTELRKLKALVVHTQKPALMLIGAPDRKPYTAWCFDRHCNGLYFIDFILSNYRNFYQKEHRFYGSPDTGEIYHVVFDDIDQAVTAAQSARFRGTNDNYRINAFPA